MSQEISSIAAKPGSEKSFGIVFATVFLLVSLYPLLKGSELRPWSLGVSVFFAVVTFVRPSLFEKPNYWWFKFGMLLGGVIAPVVMAIVYVTTIVPLGFFVRLFGKDILHIKIDKGARSYWIKRDTSIPSMRNQF